jgi:hypothetical protein
MAHLNELVNINYLNIKILCLIFIPGETALRIDQLKSIYLKNCT